MVVVAAAVVEVETASCLLHSQLNIVDAVGLAGGTAGTVVDGTAAAGTAVDTDRNTGPGLAGMMPHLG